MGSWLFTNVAMLAGLAALSIPIIIHLLLKRKKQHLRFSTLKFFLRQDQQSSQRRKLRNLLLLAVRSLLIAVLVLAFARPYLPDSTLPGANQKQRLAVLVVDRSLSMQAADAGSPRWPHVREAIQKTLADLTANDEAALITCATHSEVMSGASPPEVVARLAGQLQPAYGLGNIGEGLQLAAKIISGASPDITSTIYVISDLQVSACKDLGTYALPQNIEVKALKIGDVLAPNVAVTDLQLESKNGDPPHAMVGSFGDEQPKSVNFKLVLDGKEALARSLAFPTGNVLRVDLPLPMLEPGWHSGVAQIEVNDSLALDNTRYDSFYVPKPLKALVAETRRGKRVFEEESYFVTRALNPLQGETNAAVASPFVVEKVASGELLAKVTTGAGVSNYDLVILPGLKDVGNGLGAALTAFANAGGGLVFFLNEDVSPTRYNQEFRNLLPAQLGHLERNNAEAADLKWHLEDYDLQAAMFAVFRKPASGNLAIPEFTRRYTVNPFQGSMITARFGDESPAIITREAGRGRVALINTSADTAWSDWPKHKTFVPWLHSLCLDLTAHAKLDQARRATHFVAAEDNDVSLGASAKKQIFRVQGPTDKEAIVSADDEGRLAHVSFATPGSYSIRDRAGQALQRVVVNTPAQESDLTALTQTEFQSKLARAPEAQMATRSASLFGDNEHHKDYARWLLLAALILLLGETLLANRTYA